MLCPFENRQEIIVSQVCTIMETLFSLAVPCSIWTMKRISWWLQKGQLNHLKMIEVIFEAVFFINAKAQINLYGTAFGYAPNLLTYLPFLRIEAFWGCQFRTCR